jgi:ubiquinone/menaquinone biosynthesis C-methylase UbiE
MEYSKIAEYNHQAWRTDEKLEAYSRYNLTDDEKYLFSKFFVPDSSVLDLACGAGRTTVRLYEAGYKVKGIDLSDKLLNAAKKRFPYIVFEEGNYCSINEADNSWDNVLISFNGLDYAYPETERERALHECYRVLHSGGILIFSSHNIKWFYGMLFPWNYGIKRRWTMLKNYPNAFYDRKYIYEKGTDFWTFYASPDYIIKQVEKVTGGGLTFVEMVGSSAFSKRDRWFGNGVLNKYIHPWMSYVFVKK